MNSSHRRHSYIKVLILLGIMGIDLSWNATAQANETILDEFKSSGIDISGGITSYLQSSDGASQNATALSYSLDLNLEAAVSEHGKVAIALEAGDGKGINATLNSLSTAGLYVSSSHWEMPGE